MKRYFTFGQQHTHNYNGQTLDKDSVVVVESDNPRQVMKEMFGLKWSMEYGQPPDKQLFPGIWVSIKR